MTFALTSELAEEIISAMENQNDSFVVEATTGSLIYEDADGIRADDTNYYALPEWSSSDGFSMRENFTSKVFSPLAQEELQDILHSGRGVFKNFKNALKKYPEIDKRWHIYKHKIMSARINEWYNSLREIWGLEKLDYLADSEESLVYDDFSFSEYQSDKDKKTILLNMSAFTQDSEQQFPDNIKQALYKMWCTQFDLAEQNKQIGFICNSLSDDFAGCITGCPVSNTQDDIMVLTSLFVPETFRGLGIATELISMFINKLKSCGKKWILLPSNLIPETLEPLLTRTGFEKNSFGYLAEI